MDIINNNNWDDDKTILKYKLEQFAKQILYPKMEKYIRKDNIF